MSFSNLLAIPLLVLAAIGAKALVGGLRVRRRGDAPHCRRCDYRLTGIATGPGERCPECGAALDERNVAPGERYRTPGRATRGGILLLAALVPLAALAWREARGYDWFRLRPAGWLINDVERTGSFRATRELLRRYEAGSLGERHRDRLIGVALAEQAKPVSTPLMSDLVQFLDTAATRDQLSDAQRQRAFEQSVILALDVPPRVNFGEPVPITLRESSRTPGGRQWVRIDELSFETDDGTKRPIGGSSTLSGTGAGGSTGTSMDAKSPGEHTITVRARVRVMRGGSSFDDPAAPVEHQRNVTLTAKYEVVDPSTRPAP